MVTVVFWQECCESIYEEYPTQVQAKRAIAEYISGRYHDLHRIRWCLTREGSAYRDGYVTVRHKGLGREFGAYILH